jgi:integrase
MPKMKLTEKSIARLRAPTPSGKQTVYWDAELRGFGVLLSGVSNAKSYIAQRDLPSGKTRRITIAAAAEMTLTDAKAKAAEILVAMRRGDDPKTARKGVVTLKSALDAYLSARADLRPRSAAGYRDAVERLLADWLDLRLSDVSRDMVEARLKQIAAEAASRRAGATGHAAANSAMRALRAIYNFAADRTALPPNPVRLRKLWLPVQPRTGTVRDDELPAFYRAVTELPNPIHRDYILLLLFTGLRRREAAALRWSEVDLRNRVIRLPAARAKSGVKLDLPMSDFVRDLLVARRALGDAEFVFPSNSKSKHVEEPKFALKLVAEASGVKVSAHDLRRTYITAAESTEMSVLALKALVNHSLGGGVTENYVRMTVERLREPAQKVADRLKELCRVPVLEGAVALNNQ